MIDHNMKEVYKGSELVKLNILTENSVNKQKTFFSVFNGNEYTKTEMENRCEILPQETEYISEIQLGNTYICFFLL